MCSIETLSAAAVFFFFAQKSGSLAIDNEPAGYY